MVAATYHSDFGGVWWASHSSARVRSGTLHLYNFLTRMRILGISAFYHDSAAALIEESHIVAAAQEERFTRIRHDFAFPEKSIRYCLDEAQIDFDDIDHVVFFEKPFVKFERLVETYLANAPRGYRSFSKAIPVWIKEKLFQKSLLIKQLGQFSKDGNIAGKLLFADHHQSHAASAFFPSPFEEAIILTMDGVGEWTTSSVVIGSGNTLEKVKEIRWPHSLGLLYSAFTAYLGFRVNSGEYKVMGLAPYGTPKYADLIKEHLVDIGKDGSFWLDQRYFSYATGLTMTNRRFDDLFGGPARISESEVTQKDMDLAASIQAVAEDIMLLIARDLAKTYPKIPNLCLAGGVALNCVANGKIRDEGLFENIWIQPAAGDAGGALGAAYAAYYTHLENPREATGTGDLMKGSFLGPAFNQAEIEQQLKSEGATFQVLEDDALFEKTTDALSKGQAVGWFSGRMEFGPRALGNRSILGDPRDQGMQQTLNMRIKYRECFRPFAPAVLAEDAGAYFEHPDASPYMLFVDKVAEKRRHVLPDDAEALSGLDRISLPRSDIPAVTHVDYSARVQTVHKETNPRFHALLSAWKTKTGCSILINTSFNVRGEPIVCTPVDAYNCFMNTEMELLVCGNCILEKRNQKSRNRAA